MGSGCGGTLQEFARLTNDMIAVEAARCRRMAAAVPCTGLYRVINALLWVCDRRCALHRGHARRKIASA
jgi:hypothetical protein